MRRLQRRAGEPITSRLRDIVDEAMAAHTRETVDALAALEERVARVDDRLAEADHRMHRVRALAAATYDRIPELRSQLLAARASAEYEAAFADPEPLVSVRVATYNRSETLVSRALASVRSQTYERIEVVVVGDGCTDDTEDRLRRLGDDRIRFVNLPHRSVYPDHPVDRWYVAGGPTMNHAARLARGRWIAPIDDDDVFTPDHIERLLSTALAGRYELVYGKFWVNNWGGGDVSEPHARGAYPPRFGFFNFGTSLYLAALRFFEWDVANWVLDEPADWTVCRRMLAAGVLMGFVDDIVATIDQTGPRD